MIISRAAGCVLVVLLGLPAGVGATPTPAPVAPEQVVPAARLADLAERIARSLVPDAERALAPSFHINDQLVAQGVLTIVPGKPQVNSGYVGVPLAITVDGTVVRTVFAGFRITTYVQMPVAAHDLAPGAVLDADDLAYERVPFSGRPALQIETFVGRKVRSVVARGDAIYPEDVTVNEIVRAGMPAILIVHDGPVRLCADVVARNSGGLGDYVTIFNPATQRALSGIVTGPNTVELTLPGSDN